LLARWCLPGGYTPAAHAPSLPSAGSTTELIQYYLLGTGANGTGGVLSILNSTMGVDVPASLAQANTTLIDLKVGSGQ